MIVPSRFDDQLENDPRFILRIAQARDSLRQGKGVKLEDLLSPTDIESVQSTPEVDTAKGIGEID